MLPQEDINPSREKSEGDSFIDLEQASGQNTALSANGRSLWHWCGWYRITLNYPNLNCPQSGFWIRVRGPGFLWVQVNNQFMNFWPYYPWWNSQWIYVRFPRAKCGCNKIVFWYWTCIPWFSWGVYTPSQSSCVNNCVKNPWQYWDYRSCRCKCKHRCCSFPWRQTPIYPNPTCNCWMICIALSSSFSIFYSISLSINHVYTTSCEDGLSEPEGDRPDC